MRTDWTGRLVCQCNVSEVTEWIMTSYQSRDSLASSIKQRMTRDDYLPFPFLTNDKRRYKY